jgi:hypothetical protein
MDLLPPDVVDGFEWMALRQLAFGRDLACCDSYPAACGIARIDRCIRLQSDRHAARFGNLIWRLDGGRRRPPKAGLGLLGEDCQRPTVLDHGGLDLVDGFVPVLPHLREHVLLLDP